MMLGGCETPAQYTAIVPREGAQAQRYRLRLTQRVDRCANE